MSNSKAGKRKVGSSVGGQGRADGRGQARERKGRSGEGAQADVGRPGRCAGWRNTKTIKN